MIPPAITLSEQELCDVMEKAKVRQIMAAEGIQEVHVDYFPPREAMIYVRETDDDTTEVYPQKAITLTFTLEEAMFGGKVFAAITCGHKVVILPFIWRGYDKLGTMQIICTTK